MPDNEQGGARARRLSAVTARPPKVVWRLVSEDQFPLQGLLRLLFESGAEHEEDGDRGAA